VQTTSIYSYLRRSFRVIRNHSHDDTCPICEHNITLQNYRLETSCHHLICKNCLIQLARFSLSGTVKCPYCRTRLNFIRRRRRLTRQTINLNTPPPAPTLKPAENPQLPPELNLP